MNMKAWAPLLVAGVLGVVAMVVASRIMSSKSNPEANARTVHVVAASRDIAPGQALQVTDLTLMPISVDQAPEGAFVDATAITGRVALVQMVAGQPVLANFLADQDAGSGLQALVPPGMRAITLEVNEYSGVAGLLSAGCRVDIVTTLSGSNQETIARTIVQDVKVTAVGRYLNHAPEAKADEPLAKSVTLLVKPEQAEAIELAAQSSTPRLVLRSGKDTATANVQGVTLAMLRGDSVDKATDPFAALKKAMNTNVATQPSAKDTQTPINRRTVQIIRGTHESEIQFEIPMTRGLVTGLSMEPAMGGNEDLNK